MLEVSFKMEPITRDYLSTNQMTQNMAKQGTTYQWFKVWKMIQWSFINKLESMKIKSTKMSIYQWFEVWKMYLSSNQNKLKRKTNQWLNIRDWQLELIKIEIAKMIRELKNKYYSSHILKNIVTRIKSKVNILKLPS